MAHCIAKRAHCCYIDPDPPALFRSVLLLSCHVHCAACSRCSCCCYTVEDLKKGSDKAAWDAAFAEREANSPSTTYSRAPMLGDTRELGNEDGSGSEGWQSRATSSMGSFASATSDEWSEASNGGTKRRKSPARNVDDIANTWIHGRHDDAQVSVSRDYSLMACWRIIPATSVCALLAAVLVMILGITQTVLRAGGDSPQGSRPMDYIAVVFDVATLMFHVYLSATLWAFKRRRMHIPSVLRQVITVQELDPASLVDVDRDAMDVLDDSAAVATTQGGAAVPAGTKHSDGISSTLSQAWFHEVAHELRPQAVGHMSQLERYFLLGWLQLKLLSPKAAFKFKTALVQYAGLSVLMIAVLCFMIPAPAYQSSLDTDASVALRVVNLGYILVSVLSAAAVVVSFFAVFAFCTLNAYLVKALSGVFSAGVRHLVVKRQVTIARLANLLASVSECPPPDIAPAGMRTPYKAAGFKQGPPSGEAAHETDLLGSAGRGGGGTVPDALRLQSPVHSWGVTQMRNAADAQLKADRHAAHELSRWLLSVDELHSRLARECKRISFVLSDMTATVVLIASVGLLFVVGDISSGNDSTASSISDAIAAISFSVAPMLMVLLVLTAGSRVTFEFSKFRQVAACAPLAPPAVLVRAIWKQHAPLAMASAEELTTALKQQASGRQHTGTTSAPVLRASARSRDSPVGPGAGFAAGDTGNCGHVQSAGQAVSDEGQLQTVSSVISMLPPALDLGEWDSALIAWHLREATLAQGTAGEHGHYVPAEQTVVQLRSHIVSTMQARQGGWYIFGLVVSTSLVASVLSGLAALLSLLVQREL